VTALAAGFTAPSISYTGLAPIIVVTIAAVVGVLVDAFAPREVRWATQVGVAAAGLLGSFIAVCALAHSHEITAAGALSVDGPTLFLQGTVAVVALASVLLLADRSPELGGGSVVAEAATVPGSSEERAGIAAGRAQTEIFPLLMFAVAGMMLFPAANDLLMLFVALEVLSLPLYLMCGLARRRRLLSQEAAVKYFLLGAFSSAFFLYGLALLYGYAGTISLGGIQNATVTGTHNDTLLILGLALLGVGLLFKVGAVPFHSWIPDVYQGPPPPRSRRSARCSASSTSPSAAWAGTGGRLPGAWPSPRCSSDRCSPSPRPTSSGCLPTPPSRTPGSSSSA
jgi:NADH-quinone oxidoreductase subunit N